ncbi:MAG: aspartate aminotransferase [Arenicella sp.]|jgi:aspartate aminotransferase
MEQPLNPVSSRLTPIKPSASAWVSQAAKALKAQGHDVIDMGLGEPDFDTPAHIVEAAHAAAKAGQTRYPPTDGTAELKQAVVDKFKRENNLDYSTSQVIVSNGAKQVIFNALMASLEDGHEVLLCAPYFGQYKDMVLILGGKPVELPCSAADKFLVTASALNDAITSKTRWIILNAPSNPSGALYSSQQLNAIGDVLDRHPQVMVMADEIYEHIIFDDQKFVSFAAANPQLKQRTLIVNGVSKAYAMTGWRIGYGAGNQDLISAMVKVQSQISSGACSVAQAAAAAALNGPQDSVRDFRIAFERRRDLVVSRIQQIDGLTLDAPGGAFYAFIGCDHFIGASTPNGTTIKDDTQFTQYLLEDAKVAAVAGSAYGLSPFFRLSTATADDILNQAIDRIADSVAKLTLNKTD